MRPPMVAEFYEQLLVVGLLSYVTMNLLLTAILYHRRSLVKQRVRSMSPPRAERDMSMVASGQHVVREGICNFTFYY
ncbi:hypothetical protein BDW42DRAFT_33080 [Aspergillus taichungensis]|uniref:Uncharacterized protein n=1 Tax=Aspergillus taichungensis TaxID=482145 RepID=A0A2J5HFI4_9EURO|nr:hypothetical protein BDW42DRAFT_33080 [Aspergillus taichungensis]